MLSALLLVLACSEASDDDTGSAGSLFPGTGEHIDTEETGYVPCEETWLTVDGPDPPRVGDTWIVLFKCDGALVTGASHLSFDPPSIASVHDVNQATFLQRGTATMTMQVGTESASEEITVE